MIDSGWSRCKSFSKKNKAISHLINCVQCYQWLIMLLTNHFKSFCNRVLCLASCRNWYFCYFCCYYYCGIKFCHNFTWLVVVDQPCGFNIFLVNDLIFLVATFHVSLPPLCVTRVGSVESIILNDINIISTYMKDTLLLRSFNTIFKVE